jgi:hypothetical protein
MRRTDHWTVAHVQRLPNTSVPAGYWTPIGSDYPKGISTSEN